MLPHVATPGMLNRHTSDEPGVPGAATRVRHNSPNTSGAATGVQSAITEYRYDGPFGHRENSMQSVSHNAEPVLNLYQKLLSSPSPYTEELLKVKIHSNSTVDRWFDRVPSTSHPPLSAPCERMCAAALRRAEGAGVRSGRAPARMMLSCPIR